MGNVNKDYKTNHKKMGTLGTLFGTVACAILIYQLAKPYFKWQGDDRLDDWYQDQKRKNR